MAYEQKITETKQILIINQSEGVLPVQLSLNKLIKDYRFFNSVKGNETIKYLRLIFSLETQVVLQ